MSQYDLIKASAFRLAHLMEQFEGHNAARAAYLHMAATGEGCDLCRPGAICFWHEGTKSAWPRKETP